MIIFLYGEDTFSSRQKLNEIIEEYKKANKKGLSLRYFDAKNLSFLDLKNELQQSSIFAEKKLIVLADAFLNQKFKDDFLENTKKFSFGENIIVFFQGSKVDARDRFLKYLKKEAKTQEFQPLEGEKLETWVDDEFAKFGGRAGKEVQKKLIEYVGSDLWQMENEIKKLASFKGKDVIGSKDIDLLVSPKIDLDIFEAIDAIAQKNRKKAISLMHNHLEKGDSPVYLIYMINYQFRNLLLVRDLIDKNYPYYHAVKATGLKPFVLRKSWELAQKFSFPELKKIYQKIFQADFSIKTGKLKPEVAIDSLLCDI
ncbi:MAG: DNA polymerase III subunit delta [Candidatus Pacebacteria bacterium]|nr:DNA polymerase III subunit delta [Candidatus Paceibacterota bacterium]